MTSPSDAAVPARTPATYTPRHLAERILTSRAALEGERKQVTVLFADVKGSMELLIDRDPEEARALLDPILVPRRSRRSTPRASTGSRRRTRSSSQAASVVGKDVPHELLAAIAEDSEGALREKLGHLQTAEFL